VACLGVCRAWRAGFAPCDAWGTCAPPAHADARALRLLAPLACEVREFTPAASCHMPLEEVAAFLWSCASRRALRAVMPDTGPFTLTPEQLAPLCRLAERTSIVALVNARDGARLLPLLRRGGGLRPSDLRLDGYEREEGMYYDLRVSPACEKAI
jgi:hypothetical protein